jgi:hypothetical protein
MIVNVKKFNNFLRKATLNFSINSFSCDISPERVVSRMITKSNDAIACLDFENDIFKENKENLSFNFIDPNSSIVPYLNLVDSEEAELIARDEKLILKNGKQKSNIFFCEEMIPSKFGASEPKVQFSPFITIDVNEEFLETFNKIKKIGNKFGKIYFTVINNILQMETTDKKNKFSNGLSFDIAENVNSKDISICFDFGNMNNMFAVLDDDVSYKLDFIYVKEKDMGLMTCKRANPNSESIESYYLTSKMEV